MVTRKEKVKSFKVYLEKNNWIEKSLRISPLDPSAKTTAVWDLREESTTPSNGEDITTALNGQEYMSIPVMQEFMDMLERHSTASMASESESSCMYFKCREGVWFDSEGVDVVLHIRNILSSSSDNVNIQFGKQSCVLNKLLCTSSTVKVDLFLKSLISKIVASKESLDSDLERKLVSDMPTKFEIVGDVLMLPEGFMELQEWHHFGSDFLFEGLQSCFSQHNGNTKLKSGISRIARKARIANNLKRESQVKILWSSLDFLKSKTDAVSGTPGSLEWVHVLENKILFGFDITKVM
jgi:hypothetical protein